MRLMEIKSCTSHGGYHRKAASALAMLAIALVVGKSLFTLQGHEAALYKCVGEVVMVTGTVRGGILTVESITPVNRGNSLESLSAK